jgi:hypothetical protein
VILDSFNSSPTLKGLLTHVSSKSTLLHTSERNIGTQHRPRIDSHLARLKFLSHTVSTINIVGEDSSTEAMMRVIGFEDGFLLRGELGNAL